MERDDAEGAAAAAEYFIELYPYVMATGDTAEFEAMSHRACGFCADALAQAEKIKKNSYVYIGGESALSVTQSYVRDEITGIYPLDVKITQKSSEIRTADGNKEFAIEGKEFERRVEVGRRDDRWIVVTIAPIPEAGE